MTPEERAEKIRQMFNKAKDARDRTKEKTDGYFQVIKGFVDRGFDKIESKTAKYGGDYQPGGLMASPPKKEFLTQERTQAVSAKKPRPKRFEL